MKKVFKGLIAVCMLWAVSACGSTDDTISVLTREQGSGTRGAFIELFGIEEKDENGEKIDHTTSLAEETNSTSVMITTVAKNPNAIGYISLGSLNEDVKSLKIDGVEATAENVKNGTYKGSRPFNVVTKQDLNEIAKDFLTFILSEEGQKTVEEAGFISKEYKGNYKAKGLAGKITVAGSSSVTPVMQKLIEAYTALNPNVTIDLQQSDSTTGVSNTIDGLCDIGMVSREVKDSEIEKGVVATQIAIDGIAVIVHPENELCELTTEQVNKIFTGEITAFSEVQ